MRVFQRDTETKWKSVQCLELGQSGQKVKQYSESDYIPSMTYVTMSSYWHQ